MGLFKRLEFDAVLLVVTALSAVLEQTVKETGYLSRYNHELWVRQLIYAS